MKISMLIEIVSWTILNTISEHNNSLCDWLTSIFFSFRIILFLAKSLFLVFLLIFISKIFHFTASSSLQRTLQWIQAVSSIHDFMTFEQVCIVSIQSKVTRTVGVIDRGGNISQLRHLHWLECETSLPNWSYLFFPIKYSSFPLLSSLCLISVRVLVCHFSNTSQRISCFSTNFSFNFGHELVLNCSVYALLNKRATYRLPD